MTLKPVSLNLSEKDNETNRIVDWVKLKAGPINL
jgi:hypothetical protein